MCYRDPRGDGNPFFHYNLDMKPPARRRHIYRVVSPRCELLPWRGRAAVYSHERIFSVARRCRRDVPAAGMVRCETSSYMYTQLDTPPRTLKQVRDSIPPHLFARNTLLGLSYYTRDVVFIVVLVILAVWIDRGVEFLAARLILGARVAAVVRCALWIT